MTRSEQSRVNGAKSKGPTSDDGKARSSQNAIKHGFAAVINTVISIEDKPAWNRHLNGYRESFKPQCYAEETLVDQLASINWRQSRLVALETALIDAQLSLQKDAVADLHPNSADDPYFQLVLAWQALARQPQKSAAPNEPTAPPDGYDINSLELVRRYLVSLDRQYRNTLLNLRQCRKDFAQPGQPEPTQPSEPADTAAAAANADLPIGALTELETPPRIEQPKSIEIVGKDGGSPPECGRQPSANGLAPAPGPPTEMQKAQAPPDLAR